jgi:hypothetical protein
VRIIDHGAGNYHRLAAAFDRCRPGRTLAFRPPSNSALVAWKQATIGLHCAGSSPELKCMHDVSLGRI